MKNYYAKNRINCGHVYIYTPTEHCVGRAALLGIGTKQMSVPMPSVRIQISVTVSGLLMC